MNELTQSSFKQHLQSCLEALHDQLASGGLIEQADDDKTAKHESLGFKEVEASMKASIQREIQALTKVMDELDEDFDRCIDCCDRIPHKRLMLVPSSRYCTACAAKAENTRS